MRSPATEEVRRVAVVTGGSRGLGLAGVRALAAEGFDVAVCDLDEPEEGSRGLAKELSEFGVRSLYRTMDISDLGAHAAFLDDVERELGPVDCLLDNAGIPDRPLTDILDVQPSTFDRSVEVNLRGTFFLTQAVARRMLARADAPCRRSIIVISSVAAEIPSLSRSQYCLTKASLSMLVKLFALRLGQHGIDVHEIRPGFMRTSMTASAGGDRMAAAIEAGRVAIPRWGEPEDVGAAVATLASGRLPYLTGQPLWIAGGLNIQRAL
ncbi:3-ketoacyl-ACP reductase [Amycolatopsis sp. GM8]|uniref:3-ketoacyl-ACP reductase n=1 Tax=Amycolatopsis sp. GM8 TaxID=2896530 RepID=UPI001F008D1C|nr:3-ketoacyl-ACP reductase [Amycolatopsis sp. GM8]